jgi:hypothetical protein
MITTTKDNQQERMNMFEIEVVPIPVPEKPKGKWDDFIATFKSLQPWSEESFFVPVSGNEPNIKRLKEFTTKALNKENLKAVVHEEENPLRGGVGLRFWSKKTRQGSGRGRPIGTTVSPEGRKKIAEAQKKRWEKERENNKQSE